MPERVDAILKALLTGRSMCLNCVAARMGLTTAGAGAAVEHLAETIQVIRRRERCHTCGDIADTVGLEYGR
jgi:hypothetical protein